MLEIQQVSKTYRKKRWFGEHETIEAVKNMSFTLKQGVCLAIVGESGSGKTTLGKLIIGMEKPDSGIIQFDHINLATTCKEEKKQLQKKYSNRFSRLP